MQMFKCFTPRQLPVLFAKEATRFRVSLTVQLIIVINNDTTTRWGLNFNLEPLPDEIIIVL